MSRSTDVPNDLWTLPRTRVEAKAIGSPFYFTGKRCGRGHLDARTTHDGDCRACSHVRSQRNEFAVRLANEEERHAFATAFLSPEWTQTPKGARLILAPGCLLQVYLNTDGRHGIGWQLLGGEMRWLEDDHETEEDAKAAALTFYERLLRAARLLPPEPSFDVIVSLY